MKWTRSAAPAARGRCWISSIYFGTVLLAKVDEREMIIRD
jgi:hypothetical protein